MRNLKALNIKNAVIRITAVIIMAAMVISCLLFSTSASNSATSPNMALLEAMISGNRGWVIDTLVDDDYSTNPQAKANYLNNSASMMKEALDGYNNADNTAYGAIYKGMVDVLEKKVNADLYVQSFFDSVAEVWNENVLALFGSGDNFKSVADDLSGSLDELQYESIIKAALTADYTSSLGVTLGESESTYANIKQLKKALDSVNKWISYLRSKNNFAVGTTKYQSIEDYINDYLIPYSDSVSGYLTHVSSMASEPNEFAQKYLTDIASFMVVMYECEMHQGDDWLNYSFSADMAQFFADSGFMDVLKGAGKTLDLGSMAIDNYIYLNMLQSQKETVTGPLYRISASTEDEDLAKVMTRFADLAASQADEKMIAYETVRDYVRQNNVVGEHASDALKSMAKKIFNISDDAALTKVLAKISMIVDIATWGAEKGINIETTAKLTYELKYLNRIINECIAQYYIDLSVYNDTKTEENAGKVLDDLLLLQKLRLRGEAISYNMTSGQYDSWLGKLFLATETDAENLANSYQKHIDVLLAASVMPMTSNLITVNSGEELSLFYDYDIGWYGNYKNRSGKTIQFGDAVSAMCNTVTLNGGTLNIYNTSGASFSLPCISVNDESTINISGGDLYLYELKGSDTVNINLKNSSVLHLTGTLYSSSNINFSSAYPVEVNNAEIYSSVTGAMLKISGDSTFGSGTEIASADFCGTEKQSIKGNGGYVGSLLLTNSNLAGITAESKLYVRNSIYNSSAAVQRGKNIILLSTGSISGSYLNNDITLNYVTLNHDILFGGSVYTLGNLTANGSVNINGSYITADGGSDTYTHTFTDKNLTVKGDVYLRRVTLSGLESLNINGDFNIDVFSLNDVTDISVGGSIYGGGESLNTTLTLNGNSAQKIESITVSDLVINNTKGNVNVTGAVSVTNSAENPSGEIENGNKITLAKGAVLSGDIWRGSLTVNDWTREDIAEITGSLYTLQNCTVNGDINIGTNLYAKSGLSLVSSNLTVAKNAALESNITADSESNISIGNDFSASSVSASGTLTVSGDLECDSGTVSVLTLNGKLRQNINCSLTLTDLVLENTSEDGIIFTGSITVNGTFYKNNVNFSGNGTLTTGSIVGSKGKMSKLILKDAVLNEDIEIESDLTVVTALTLNDCTLTLDGMLKAGNVQITVDQSSTMNLNGDTALTNSSHLTVEGTVNSLRDIYLNNCTVSGNGTLTASGDLKLNSGSFNLGGALILNGKTAQTVSGNTITVKDLVLENTSRDGITFKNTVNYSGELTNKNTHVIGETYLIAKNSS